MNMLALGEQFASPSCQGDLFNEDNKEQNSGVQAINRCGALSLTENLSCAANSRDATAWEGIVGVFWVREGKELGDTKLWVLLLLPSVVTVMQ